MTNLYLSKLYFN